MRDEDGKRLSRMFGGLLNLWLPMVSMAQLENCGLQLREGAPELLFQKGIPFEHRVVDPDWKKFYQIIHKWFDSSAAEFRFAKGEASCKVDSILETSSTQSLRLFVEVIVRAWSRFDVISLSVPFRSLSLTLSTLPSTNFLGFC